MATKDRSASTAAGAGAGAAASGSAAAAGAGAAAGAKTTTRIKTHQKTPSRKRENTLNVILPKSVMLRNLFVPQAAEAALDHRRRRRPYFSDSYDSARPLAEDFGVENKSVDSWSGPLLVPARLELYLSTLGDEDDAPAQKRILLSSLNPSSSSPSSPPLHPVWDHLDEIFQQHIKDYQKHRKKEDDDEEEEEGDDSTSDNHQEEAFFNSIHMRIVFDEHNEETKHACLSCPWIADSKLSDHKQFKLEECQSPAQFNHATVLAEAPLNPTMLRVLPKHQLPSNPSSNTNQDFLPTTAEADLSLSANNESNQITIPSSLPPNSLLVAYTDGFTRVLPQLYRLLRQKQVIRLDSTMDKNIREDLQREERGAKRFSDSAFDCLGQSPSSINKATTRTTPPPFTPTDTITNTAADSAFRDVAFDLLGGPALNHNKKLPQTTSDINVFSVTPQQIFPDNLAFAQQSTDTEDVTTTSLDHKDHHTQTTNQLKLDLERLQSMLQEEEDALKEDESLFKSEMEELKTLLNRVKQTEDETERFKDSLSNEMAKLHTTEEILDLRRIKLLNDLRLIYPIRRAPIASANTNKEHATTLSASAHDNAAVKNNIEAFSYTIRDLPLPMDLHGTSSVTDTVISSALGFVCHLTFMCSKYLSIPLRYRLVCNASKSAIQDDGKGVFPLFKERGVDKDQFDHGILLLDRNIQCLLHRRRVTYRPDAHFLEKLSLLFEKGDNG